jgi:DNA-binding LacI/PurR family transcriptional regulator
MLQQFKYPAPGNRSSVGLRELAADLGLSQATISRVINRSPAANRIPQSTQNRIFEAAARLKYEANIFARGLRNKRSFTVGVIIPEISEGYSTTVLSGVEDVLVQKGFFYFVVSHRHRSELLKEYPRLLLSRAVEGIIAVDTQIEEVLPVPVVAVSGHKRVQHIVNIQLDHTRAVRLALEHLFALGHRKIAFIKGQIFSSDTKLRWRAICDVSYQLGIAIDPQLTVQLEGTSPGIEPGHIATRTLIQRKKCFTAIFAFNDLAAIGAIGALREAGLRVPYDISVVGFDDILSASTNNPSLTTVHQPLHDMGGIAASTLLDLIGGKNPSKRVIRVEPSFIVRDSTSQAQNDS